MRDTPSGTLTAWLKLLRSLETRITHLTLDDLLDIGTWAGLDVGLALPETYAPDGPDGSYSLARVIQDVEEAELLQMAQQMTVGEDNVEGEDDDRMEVEGNAASEEDVMNEEDVESGEKGEDDDRMEVEEDVAGREKGDDWDIEEKWREAQEICKAEGKEWDE